MGSVPSVACWGSCSLHVAGYNTVVDCQLGSLFPPLDTGVNVAPASVQALMLAMLEPKLQAMMFGIRSLTMDEWSYPQLL